MSISILLLTNYSLHKIKLCACNYISLPFTHDNLKASF